MRGGLRAKMALALAVVAGLVVTGVLPASAGPTLFRFNGIVRDGIGRPLANATVRDQYKSTTTADDGSYVLPESSNGSFTLSASRSDTLTNSRVVSVVIPVDRTVDFTLLYRDSASLSRTALSTATGPTAATLTVTSYAPFPGGPGGSGKSCVWVTDSRTALTSLATYVSTDPTSGASSWTYALYLPQAATGGVYSLSSVTTDCAAGTVLTLTDSRTYVVDNTRPEVSGPSPEGWTGSVVALGLTARDSGGSGLDFRNSSITVDGSALAAVRYDPGTGRLAADAAGLSPGEHTAEARARDYAGNESALQWSFVVDPTPPALVDSAPQGVVSDSTPLIAVHAVDSDSGIDAESISMTLSNGIWALTSQPQASFDEETGTISYQVPDEPRGAALGEFFLPDGSYEVEVVVRDRAGNESQLGWSFTVRTLVPA